MGLFGKKDYLIIENDDMKDNVILRKKLPSANADVTIQVMANTEAIVLMNGAVLGVYNAGRHTIELPKKEKSMDVSVVYVNKTVRLRALWGTPSKIEFIDSQTEIPVSLGASGEVSFEVNNSMKLFERAMGTSDEVNVEKLKSFLKNSISTEAKDILARKLTTEGLGFYDLSKELKQVSKDVKSELVEKFNEYGTSVVEFSIDNLVYPNEIKDLIAKAAKERYEMKQKNTSYDDIRKKEELEKEREYELAKLKVQATNPQAQASDDTSDEPRCRYCKNVIEKDSSFCQHCGKTQATNKQCPDCQKTLDIDAKFCSGCGKAFN